MPSEQVPLFPDKPVVDAGYVLPLREIPREEAEGLARKILEVLQPFCERIEVAGSIRRQKATVNDIDFVVLPRAEPVSKVNWLNIIRVWRSNFDPVTEKQGNELLVGYVPHKAMYFPDNHGTHVQVDLYRATASTWGIQLLVRTGSKEHNVHFCNLALTKGMRLQYSQGLVDKDGRVVAGRTEEEVFTALGLPYIIPQEREMMLLVPGKGMCPNTLTVNRYEKQRR